MKTGQLFLCATLQIALAVSASPASGQPTPVSCSAILLSGKSVGDGLYSIDPEQDGSTVEVYCDMTTAGGGWTLAGYGQNARLAGPLSVPNGAYAPLVRSGSANIAALALARASTEVALSWSTGRRTGSLLAYDAAVSFRIPNPTEQTLVPLGGGHRCADTTWWTPVKVQTLVGRPELPARMFTRTRSLGAVYGHGYGLVNNPATNAQCDWYIDRQAFTAVYLAIANAPQATGTPENARVAGVVGENGRFANHMLPNTMAIWFRHLLTCSEESPLCAFDCSELVASGRTQLLHGICHVPGNVLSGAAPPPPSYRECAREGEPCFISPLSEYAYIYYGAGNRWVRQQALSSRIQCDSDSFGNPTGRDDNRCLAPPRFVDKGDGTIVDTTTGLAWLADVDCLDYSTISGWKLTLELAMGRVAYLRDRRCGLSDGSKAGDWRLPTQSEWTWMMTLVDGDKPRPRVFGADDGGVDVFPGQAEIAPDVYWSSTIYPDKPRHVFVADLQAGTASGHLFSGFRARAWPVRPSETGCLLGLDPSLGCLAPAPAWPTP